MQKNISIKSSVTRVGGGCPVKVSIPILCEDVCETFSFEPSMLPVGWHVLWNVTDKRVWVKYKLLYYIEKNENVILILILSNNSVLHTP